MTNLIFKPDSATAQFFLQTKFLRVIGRHLFPRYSVHVSGSKFYLRNENLGFYDDVTLNEVILQDCYKAATRIKQGDTVVDVGANIGCFSVLAARIVGRSGKVIAFEPAPDNFELLKTNIGTNDLGGICKIHQLALGDTQGELVLNILPAGSLYSIVRKDNSKKSISVMSKTLDSFELDQVDFLKIDVEGFEYEVLKGSVSTLKRSHPEIALETHPWADKDSIIFSLLSDLGYSISIHNTKETAILYATKRASIAP